MNQPFYLPGCSARNLGKAMIQSVTKLQQLNEGASQRSSWAVRKPPSIAFVKVRVGWYVNIYI